MVANEGQFAGFDSEMAEPYPSLLAVVSDNRNFFLQILLLAQVCAGRKISWTHQMHHTPSCTGLCYLAHNPQTQERRRRECHP
ncbi:hypothetical protein IC582_007416 [Cucumis melo]